LVLGLDLAAEVIGPMMRKRRGLGSRGWPQVERKTEKEGSSPRWLNRNPKERKSWETARGSEAKEGG
jgi:hypothetical protein